MFVEYTRLHFTENDPISVIGGQVTIFVGPNNSGKSLVLREIAQYIESGRGRATQKIVQEVAAKWPSFEELKTELDAASVPRPNHDESYFLPRYTVVGEREETTINKNQVRDLLAAKANPNTLFSTIAKPFLLVLDGRNRLQLCQHRPIGDLTAPPDNHLSRIYRDTAMKEQIRELVYRSIGRYLVFDPTSGGELRLRLADQPPGNLETRLDEEAVEYHRAAEPVASLSDGVKAFVGSMCALFSGRFKTIVVDEPEAFLHPPLARRLGSEMARIAYDQKATVYASTHSADFIAGCLSGGAPVSIVRLEYRQGKSRGRLIDAASLRTITTHPLMRTANTLSGLFYDGMVVCEADADEVFYSEVYTRLSAGKDDLPSVRFAHAQNKQTLKQIVGSMRECGVPTAAIADIDILNLTGKDWTSLLKAMRVPEAQRAVLSDQRSKVWAAFPDGEAKTKGLRALARRDRDVADHLLRELASYGLFVVPSGELETWLPSLNINSKKIAWLLEVLEKMGSDPFSSGYVRPGNDDVWAFLKSILGWIRNPQRLGMAEP